MEDENENLVFILFFNGQKFRFEDKTENRIQRMMIQHIEQNLQTPERFLEREGTFLKVRSNWSARRVSIRSFLLPRFAKQWFCS
ncbi:hypothetical protein pv_310 [Pithovirus sibericum]|uniref:Uncharacterized protein n=1 Tax=Pithovirus sibericum TaxID=1450746 RepID=W5S6B5_9VIRU|nr:hypothetical protein pv_310 [Pithovirus sibericum]AHH01877.1 hypothetical protein pv_310 [Pithovirus sibericum]